MSEGSLPHETPEYAFWGNSKEDIDFPRAMQCIRKLEKKLEKENERNKLVVSKLERKIGQVLRQLNEVHEEKEVVVAEGMDLQGQMEQLNKVNDKKS